MSNDAFRFLQEATGKADWVETIKNGKSVEVVELAQENGYKCDMDDLKKVASEIIHGSGEPEDVSSDEIEEAEAGSVGFDQKGGYGSDSGFSMMSGIAAALLKKSA